MFSSTCYERLLKLDFYFVWHQQLRALDKAYVISSGSKEDIKQLLRALGNIRSLLLVQAGPSEEDLMKNSLKSVTLLTGLVSFIKNHRNDHIHFPLDLLFEQEVEIVDSLRSF